MAVFPQLFTATDPYFADLAKAREAAVGGRLVRSRQPGLRRLRPHHLRGPGLDPGRASSPPLFTLVFGSLVGIISGYRGGWVDAVLQPVGEIFFAIPLLLGGILFLYTFPSDLETPFLVVGRQGGSRARRSSAGRSSPG